MMIRSKWLVLGAALAGPVFAAGFSVDTHGGKATGMATAVVASIDDPSSVFYNPAGILHGKRLQLQLGDTAILASLRFASAASGQTTQNERAVSPPPHLYGTYKLNKQMALGLGVFVNFGNSARWPPGWEFRNRALSSALSTYNINPTFAYAIGEKLRVGVGAQVVRASVSTTRVLNFLDTESTVTLDGAGTGFGFNAGAQYDLIPEVATLGVSYRSQVSLNFAGVARFNDVPVELQGQLRDQVANASLKVPDTAFAGLAVRPMQELLLTFDAHWFNWSVLDAVRIDFPDDARLSQTFWKRWNNTISWHAGAEYQFTPETALRMGFVYDPTPSPADTLTMELPDANRVKGAFGIGTQFNNRFRLDLGYQILVLLPNDSTAAGFEGQYTGWAHLVGITLGFKT